MTDVDAPAVIACRDLVVRHPAGRAFARRRALTAVDGVSLAVARGETLALVGESGCGKSTLAHALVRLLVPTTGAVFLEGEDITALRGAALRARRRRMQIVLQSAGDALHPRRRVHDLLAEPLLVHRVVGRDEVAARVVEWAQRVGLDADLLQRSPRALSGGQRQRVALARALAVEPAFLACDEPTSALDARARTALVELIAAHRRDRAMGVLFVTHDLSGVERHADRVAVMALGALVEIAPASTLLADPWHPYTRALVAAAPSRRASGGDTSASTRLQGEPANPFSPPSGCRLHPRCPEAMARCRHEAPRLLQIGARAVACHLYEARESSGASPSGVAGASTSAASST